MRCQQGTALSENFGPNDSLSLKQLTLNSGLGDNVSWTTNSDPTYAQCYAYGPVPGYDYLSYHWANKMLQIIQTTPASFYKEYVENELLCPVKCIYAYLVQRSNIVTQDFT